MNLCNSVPSEIDFLQFWRKGKKSFRQRFHQIAFERKHLQIGQSKQSLIADLTDLVAFQFQLSQVSIRPEGLVADGHDLVVAQVNFHQLG